MNGSFLKRSNEKTLKTIALGPKFLYFNSMVGNS